MSNFKKIQKLRAKKLYNTGVKIYVVPCNVYPNFDNPWIIPFELEYSEVLKNQDIEYPSLAFENTFDSRINAYEYYNCNSELGYYPHYYIIEEVEE